MIRLAVTGIRLYKLGFIPITRLPFHFVSLCIAVVPVASAMQDLQAKPNIKTVIVNMIVAVM